MGLKKEEIIEQIENALQHQKSEFSTYYLRHKYVCGFLSCLVANELVSNEFILIAVNMHYSYSEEDKNKRWFQ